MEADGEAGQAVQEPMALAALRTAAEDEMAGWHHWRLLDGITNSVDMNLSKLWEIVEDRGAWLAAVHGVTKRQT